MRSRPRKPAWPSLVWNTSGNGVAAQLGVELDRAHAADAEQQLLQQAVLAAATVEAVGDRAQGVLVLGDVGVEQQQRDAADRDPPHARGERLAVGQRQGHEGRGAVRVAQHRQRQAVGVEHRVALLLPALARDRLAEVAGAVEQADGDDRHAEVAGRLEVVAGEDAEAARVLRQRRRDAELGREVADRLRGVGETLVPARLGEVGAQVVDERVRGRDEGLVGRELVQARGLDRAEQGDRVVVRRLPQVTVDLREQAAGRLVPRPAEVRGEFVERREGLGQHGADGEAADGLHTTSLGARRGSANACTERPAPSQARRSAQQSPLTSDGG